MVPPTGAVHRVADAECLDLAQMAPATTSADSGQRTGRVPMKDAHILGGDGDEAAVSR